MISELSSYIGTPIVMVKRLIMLIHLLNSQFNIYAVAMFTIKQNSMHMIEIIAMPLILMSIKQIVYVQCIIFN